MYDESASHKNAETKLSEIFLHRTPNWTRSADVRLEIDLTAQKSILDRSDIRVSTLDNSKRVSISVQNAQSGEREILFLG